MIATCSNCETKFRVDDAKLGPRGARVKCSHCGTSFIVRPENQEELADVRVGEAAQPRAPMANEPTLVPLREIPLEFTPTGAMLSNRPKAESPAPDVGRFDLEPSAAAPPPLRPQPLEPSPPPIPKPEPKRAPAAETLTLDEVLDSDVEPSTTGTHTLLDLAGPTFAVDNDRTKPGIDLRALERAAGSAESPFETNRAPTPILDEPTLPMAMQNSGPLNLENSEPTRIDAPPAGMPTFDDDAPSFDGGLSSEGIITKNVDMRQLRSELRAQPVATIALDRAELRDVAADHPIEPPPRVSQNPKSRLFSLLLGAATGLFALALVAVYLAGGWEGLRADKGPDQALRVSDLRVIPYASIDGSRFWILRGQVGNFGEQAQFARVEVTGSTQGTEARLGMALDALALYRRGEVVLRGNATEPLPAGGSAAFDIAVSAGGVADAGQLKVRVISP